MAGRAHLLRALLLVVSFLGAVGAAEKQPLTAILNKTGPAPIGLITNRPTKFTVAHLFPELETQLVRAAKAPEHSVKAFDDVYISTSRELLLRLLGRAKPMEGLRIFVGHSGWAPGQLEAEIGHGDWTLGSAKADAIFSNKGDHPWPSASGNEPKT